jgi:very-short-patch-repair endonuclease
VRLVVEVDGGYHLTPARVRADARRGRYMGKLGYRVLRLPGPLVQHQLSEAVVLVAAALRG